MNKTARFFRRLAITRPFASGDDATLTEIKSVAGEDNSVNYNDGFPAAYSTPKSNNGKYVSRGEMNAIGNLASQNQFYFMAGGINTFDQDFCEKIGGYPEGAVLKYLNNGYLYDVISLVDNNTFDFNISGVDGIRWDYLSVTEKKLYTDTFFKGGENIGLGTSYLGTVVAKKSAPLVVISAPKLISVDELIADKDFSGSSILTASSGISVIMFDHGSSYPSSITWPTYSVDGTITANRWKQLSGNYTLWRMSRGQVTTNTFDMANPFVQEGNYYSFALVTGAGNITFQRTETGIVTDNNYKQYAYEGVTGELNIAYS